MHGSFNTEIVDYQLPKKRHCGTQFNSFKTLYIAINESIYLRLGIVVVPSSFLSFFWLFYCYRWLLLLSSSPLSLPSLLSITANATIIISIIIIVIIIIIVVVVVFVIIIVISCIFISVTLFHWGRVTYICVVKLTIIVSDNGLSPGRRQAIIWTNAGILLIGPLGTYFSGILIEIHTFWFKKMHLKMSSAKWRPFNLGFNVLIPSPSPL